VDDLDGADMLSITIRTTGYRHAGNWRLGGQRVRGEVEMRGTSV